MAPSLLKRGGNQMDPFSTSNQPTTRDEHEKKAMDPWLILAIVLAVLLVVSTLVAFIIFYRIRKQRRQAREQSEAAAAAAGLGTTTTTSQHHHHHQLRKFHHHQGRKVSEADRHELERDQMIQKSRASRVSSSWSSHSSNSSTTTRQMSGLAEYHQTTTMMMAADPPEGSERENDDDDDDGDDGTTAGSRPRGDWKEWEARMNRERSDSLRDHPALSAGLLPVPPPSSRGPSPVRAVILPREEEEKEAPRPQWMTIQR
ncbi:hypothetical protein F4778DRAFT_733822 [Xylariomycetidae sp. FL2044]|nr:hypothetical protein F4778DRAFT_733822 [Xylariomycetidae sp. FL2044]